jgi:hypothetical protein
MPPNIVALCKSLDAILERSVPVLKLDRGSKEAWKQLDDATRELIRVCITVAFWDRAWSIWRVWRQNPDWIRSYPHGVTRCAVDANEHHRKQKHKRARDHADDDDEDDDADTMAHRNRHKRTRPAVKQAQCQKKDKADDDDQDATSRPIKQVRCQKKRDEEDDDSMDHRSGRKQTRPAVKQARCQKDSDVDDDEDATSRPIKQARSQKKDNDEGKGKDDEDDEDSMDLSECENLENKCREWIASALVRLCVDEESEKYKSCAADMHPRDVRMLLQFMTQTLDLPECMADACELVARVTESNAKNGFRIAKQKGIALVVQALRRHAKDDKVVKQACAALAPEVHTDGSAGALAVAEGVRVHSSVLIGTLGGIPLLLDAVQQHANSPRIAAHALRALASLASFDGNQREFIRSNGIAVLLKQLAPEHGLNKQKDDAVFEVAADAADTAADDADADADAHKNKDRTEVVKWACLALASLAEDCQEVQRLIVEQDGVVKLLEVVLKYSADREVLGDAVWALEGLFADDGLRSQCVRQIPSQSALEEFLSAVDHHKTDEDIWFSVWRTLALMSKNLKAPMANNDPIGTLFVDTVRPGLQAALDRVFDDQHRKSMADVLDNINRYIAVGATESAVVHALQQPRQSLTPTQQTAYGPSVASLSYPYQPSTAAAWQPSQSRTPTQQTSYGPSVVSRPYGYLPTSQ